MPQRIFAVGRARKARRVAEPIPPVNSLAAAGRRQRPPRNSAAAEPATAPPARMIVPGGPSKRRLAGAAELPQRDTTARPELSPGAASLPIRSLTGQEQAALWDWYDFDQKRSLLGGSLTTGSPPTAAPAGAATHGGAATGVPANRAVPAAPANRAVPPPVARAVPTAPGNRAIPAPPANRPIPPASPTAAQPVAGQRPSQRPIPLAEPNRQRAEYDRQRAELDRQRTELDRQRIEAEQKRTENDGKRTAPDGQRAVARASAGASALGQQASAGGGWDLPRSGAGQPVGPPAAAGPREQHQVPRADQQETVGPPAHPLRRVLDPAGGQRTHPRRVGHEPVGDPATPKAAKQPKEDRAARRDHAAAPKSPPTAGATDRKIATRKRRLRIVGFSLLGAAVVVLAAGAWVGWRTYQAYNHLQNASVAVQMLQDQLSDITESDPAATATTIAGLQTQTAAALEAVDDPLYRAATGVPFVGPNLDAIRLVTVNVDSLATKVMPSLVDVATNLQPAKLAPKDGQVDLGPIEAISPLLQDADAAVNEARGELATIDQSELAGPVADAVQTVSTKLANAADVTGPGARTARLLPPMLGSEGERTYLVVFQNPAEARATGGIFGSYATLTADNGKFTIDNQASASRTLDDLTAPVGAVSENEKALYTDLIATRPQDVNFTPDFPSAAQRFIAMYQLKNPGQIDGVLAIDPIALSYMLKGSPGIPVGNDTVITSDNLVKTLLSDAYTQFGSSSSAQEARDQFLDDATGKVFSEVMSGNGDPRAILDGLSKASDEPPPSAPRIAVQKPYCAKALVSRVPIA